jgi:hypothetical protein
MNTGIYTGSDHRSVIPYVQCGCIKFFIEARILVIMFQVPFFLGTKNNTNSTRTKTLTYVLIVQ